MYFFTNNQRVKIKLHSSKALPEIGRIYRKFKAFSRMKTDKREIVKNQFYTYGREKRNISLTQKVMSENASIVSRYLWNWPYESYEGIF